MARVARKSGAAMVRHRSIAVIIVLSQLLGCGSNDSVHINHGLRLSDEQLSAKKSEADRGNAEAAHLVWQHYTLAKHDSERGRPWLRKAAELGLPESQWTLGYSLLSEDAGNEEEALYYIRLAAKSGNEAAKRFLKRRNAPRKRAERQGF